MLYELNELNVLGYSQILAWSQPLTLWVHCIKWCVNHGKSQFVTSILIESFNLNVHIQMPNNNKPWIGLILNHKLRLDYTNECYNQAWC